ncbi:hypothetical protein V1522DRAFT_400326 [Lipomyces starkeyi]
MLTCRHIDGNMAHQLAFMSEDDDSGALFKRRRQASFDESDAGTGITSTVLSPAIHIVPPRHDKSRDRTNPEMLHRKRRMGEDDRVTTCDSSDTLLDEDEEMRDDATYVDCDDLGSNDDDENVVESMVEVYKTGELIRAHVPEYWKRKNHFVRLWQSLAGRIEHEGPTSPLRYLASWTNENRKHERMAQKRRSFHTSSGSSIGEDRFWTGNGKRRRSSMADSTLDVATSNDDSIASKKSHRPISMSSSDIGDIRQSPRRNSNESGLPRYYPGGWPTPPGENDETDDDDDGDAAMNTEKDDCDLLISSELALDAQVMGPSVSEYFILDRDRDPDVCDALAVTPESDDKYDDDEDAEYFHDFGSLLQSLHDVAKGCTSSVCSPSSSAGFMSPTRPPIIVIDHDNNKRDNTDNKNKTNNDKEDGDDIAHGAGVDYDDCNLAPEFEDTSRTVENDGFEIVVRDGTSLSSSPIEGCGIVARMPSSFPT